MPHHFVCDRPLLICFLESRGEQVDLRLHFASLPVRPQRVQQLRREWQFPIARVLTLMNVDDHALAVDIGDLQLRGFGSPQTGSVQKQQDRAVSNVGCGRNQFLDLFRAEHYGKLLRYSGQLHVVQLRIVPLENLLEKEMESGNHREDLITYSFKQEIIAYSRRTP